MNTITINGAALVDTRVSEDGNTLIVRCVKNTSEKKDGQWGLKANYFSMLLRDNMRSRFEGMKAKPGSSLWVVGSYTTSTYTSEDGNNTYLNMTVHPYDFGYSSGSVGSTGLFDVTHTNIGLINDPTTVNESFHYIDGLYDIGYGENKRTEKLRLCFNGTLPTSVAKGKRIDVIGRLDITLNQGKDGKTYANKTVYVKEYNKTPFTPKKEAPADGAPVQNQSPAPAAVAQTPVQTVQPSMDLSEFEDLSADSGVFF